METETAIQIGWAGREGRNDSKDERKGCLIWSGCREGQGKACGLCGGMFDLGFYFLLM